MATVTPDKIAAAVEKILDDYEGSVKENLDVIVKKVAQKGASMLRSQSRSAVGGTGEYAKGWKARTQAWRLSVAGTIYNADLPGLPHLLEHGHANRGGGRTPGRVHIAPVEEKLVNEFERQVMEKL